MYLLDILYCTVLRVCIALTSSAFRRMTRLFLPPLIVSFSTMLLIAAGAWDYPAEVAADRTIISAESEFHQPRLAGLGDQLMGWGVMVVRMLDYGHWDEYYPPYDVHLWTIPMEYCSSMPAVPDAFDHRAVAAPLSDGHYGRASGL
jgi:hypothetical protein